MKKHAWSGTDQFASGPQTEKAHAYMMAQGCTDIGALGFCWGVGPAFVENDLDATMGSGLFL